MYRKKKLYGKFRNRIGEIIRDLCHRQGVELLVSTDWIYNPVSTMSSEVQTLVNRNIFMTTGIIIDRGFTKSDILLWKLIFKHCSRQRNVVIWDIIRWEFGVCTMASRNKSLDSQDTAIILNAVLECSNNIVIYCIDKDLRYVLFQ